MNNTFCYRPVDVRCILLACFILFGALGLRAAATNTLSEVVCPKTTGPLVIDGKLDDADWEKAATVGPLVTLVTLNKPDHDLTTAKLQYDDNMLYLAVKCSASAAKELKKHPNDHGAVWGNDHIEVFLNPQPDTNDYYQLAVDRAGTTFDSFYVGTNIEGAAWNGKWQAAVMETADGWTLELALPFESFGVKGVKPGDLWRIKVGRDAGQDGPIMWPPNYTYHFNSRLADGALYFGQRGAKLRQVKDEHSADNSAKPDWGPGPDPIHGLEAFCERAGHKPWDLYWRGNELLTYRVMFRDRKLGTWMWMLDNSPAVAFCLTASIWSGWNVDGSVMHLTGRRPTVDGKEWPTRWLCNADFSRLKFIKGGSPLWDLTNPDVFYTHSPGNIKMHNFRTGESRVLASWEPRVNERAYGLTKDNQSVFVVDHDGGLWVPYTPGDEPLPDIYPLDCYGQAPNGKNVLTGKETKHAKNVSFVGPEGPLFRIIIGTRVYTDTGRTERVIVPISGHTEYLKTFASGRVRFPTNAAPPATKDINELFQIYQFYPSCSHGHNSYSPDGEYICWDGGWNGNTRHHRVSDNGDQHKVIISADGGTYHTCWFYNPRFYFTCVRVDGQLYERPHHNSGIIAQIFTDGTWQPICDIKARAASFYYQGSFVMLSRDATKVHYGSSMTGVLKNYIAVIARPQPPRNISWQAETNVVVLGWQAPPFHKEIAGYLVYRSDHSGDGYELLTRDPVRATTWRDATVTPGRPYYYVVTALEQEGIESGYSAEAARAGAGLATNISDALVVYAEMEEALADLGSADRPGLSTGRDLPTASDWYYLYRSPDSKQGAAKLQINAPISGAYMVWLRVRQTDRQAAAWNVAIDGQAAGRAECKDLTWTWVKLASATKLTAGPHVVEMSTSDAGAQADVLCLATDPAFTPRGPRPEDTQGPAGVQGLKVVQVRGRAVQITWQPSTEPDLWHYNVYASRQPLDAPKQEYLLASPTYPEFIDWGLQAGTTYHYAVMAVDRRGNEGPLSAAAQAVTPAREYPPQHIELLFDQASLEGNFQRADAPGTHGKQYVMVPGNAATGEVAAAKASWIIDIPHGGTNYFWLRYLPNGPASKRHVVAHNVKVLIDGNFLTEVGGGRTDLSTPDSNIHPELWTWARPAEVEMKGVILKPGRHTLTLINLNKDIRYDALVVTDEPSWQPADGRILQDWAGCT